MKPIYTVSVKRWFGWKSYRVTNHFREDFASGAWLVLELADGSTITVPTAKLVLRVHRDYALGKEAYRAHQAEIQQEASLIVAKHERARAEAEQRRAEANLPKVPINPYSTFVPPLTGHAPQ